MRKSFLVISIIITSLSLYYAFTDVSLDELKQAFMSLNYIFLIPTVLLMLLSFVFRAMRWRYMLRSVKEIKITRLFSPLIIGGMGNMLPARAGEFIRAFLLSKRENISFSTSFATIIAERLFDLAAVLLLLIGVLFINTDAFSRGGVKIDHELFSYMLTFGWISCVLCMLIIAFSVVLQYQNELAMKIVSACTRPLPQKWKEKIMAMLTSFTEGFNIIKDRRGFLAVTSLSLLILVLFILFNYPLYLAFGIENSLPVISSLFVLCLTVDIFVALFPTPGFLGAFQAAYVIALHEIYGISKAVAASLGIIAWLGSMGVIMVIGVFFVIRDNVSLGKININKTT